MSASGARGARVIVLLAYLSVVAGLVALGYGSAAILLLGILALALVATAPSVTRERR